MNVIGIATVNVGTPSILADVRGEHVWSGIRKHPVAPTTTLWVSALNVAGDGQADLRVHGGVDKAVYAYPSEHHDPWAEELGQELGTAPFGENLGTVGVLERDVRLGDIWQWGSAILQVTQPRWPCFKLNLYRNRADIQARLRASGRTGWYLRVLEPGEVSAARPIRLAARDRAGVTVLDAHLAMSDRSLLDLDRVRAVIGHPALADQWRAPLLSRLQRGIATRGEAS